MGEMEAGVGVGERGQGDGGRGLVTLVYRWTERRDRAEGTRTSECTLKISFDVTMNQQFTRFAVTHI